MYRGDYEKHSRGGSGGIKRTGSLSGRTGCQQNTGAESGCERNTFAKDEEISTHQSLGDAFVTCLDGVGRITIDGVDYELQEGDSIVMPAQHPHAVHGKENFKMLLVVVF